MLHIRSVLPLVRTQYEMLCFTRVGGVCGRTDWWTNLSIDKLAPPELAGLLVGWLMNRLVDELPGGRAGWLKSWLVDELAG